MKALQISHQNGKKVVDVSDFNFFQYVGPAREIFSSELPSEGEVFNILLGDNLYEHMVFQANLYATQKLKPFSPTNIKEMKRFIAVNFLMGIEKLSSYKDYWSSHPMIQDQYISKTMSLKRFQWFLSNFHLNDNTKMPSREDNSYDKLYKVWPFLKNLNKQFLNCYEPSEVQAIDESMIKFKGRRSVKQYIPLKPIKRGCKVWVRADENGKTLQAYKQ